jgi:hypothetical protein
MLHDVDEIVTGLFLTDTPGVLADSQRRERRPRFGRAFGEPMNLLGFREVFIARRDPCQGIPGIDRGAFLWCRLRRRFFEAVVVTASPSASR